MLELEVLYWHLTTTIRFNTYLEEEGVGGVGVGLYCDGQFNRLD